MGLSRTVSHITSLLESIKKQLYCKYLKVFYPQLRLGKGVIFNKPPLLQINSGAIVKIGNAVTINSNNFGYHINMFMPCKIMADADGAEIAIGDNTRVHGSCIHAKRSITIGKNCLIAANCQIIDSNGHAVCMSNPERRLFERDMPAPVVIEDNVWLATGVIVLPGVTIGEGSIVAANSVVCKDIPPRVLARGNPAVPVERSPQTEPEL